MNTKHNNIKNNQRKKVILSLFAIITFALVVEVLILSFLNKKNSTKTVTVLLNQVVNILAENEKREQDILHSLKEEYMTNTQTIAYLLDSNPEIADSTEELQKIAALMGIDEIHLFDENGVIYFGTEPQYYGLNFDSGEQMSYFKPMLTDKSLTMCQDVMPNTALGKQMMYAITWSKTGTHMIQIGVEPKRLLKELQHNEISEVIAGMPAYSGLNIYVSDKDSGIISGSTDKSSIGKTLKAIPLPVDLTVSDRSVRDMITISGYRHYMEYCQVSDYVVAVTYSTKSNLDNFFAAFILEFIYLILAGLVVFLVFDKLLDANVEKNEQLSLLFTMSDIYFSMHLIDLENNSIKEYRSRNERVNGIVLEGNAYDIMPLAMANITEDSHVEAARAFVDLHTLPDRMQNKKMISAELISKYIGWYVASFITIEADSNGKPTKVVYVTRDINDEKKKEELLIARSNTDELTGLYNRRAYEADVDSFEDKVPNTFVYISMDVNGLKVVNDTLGHSAGDELLIGACECMKQCFAPYGRIYRTGGDEFAAMIFADAKQLKKIKRDFENTLAGWSGNYIKNITVSCGYITKREAKASSIRHMAQLADKRMYRAKSEYYQKTGVDRRGQKEAHTALCALYTKILKVNITSDTFQIINMDSGEQTSEKGFSDKFSEWLQNFGATSQVHPDDLKEYSAKSNLEYMRDYFKGDNTSLMILYRRKKDGEYKQTMMELIPAGDYSDDNQSLFLYVKSIEK